MRENNRYSAVGFVWEHLFWGAFGNYFYRNVCFRCLGGLTYKQSSLALYGLLGLFCLAGIALGWKRQRNGMTVAIDLLLPLEVYTILSYGKFLGVWFWISGLLSLALSAAVVLWLRKRPIRNPERERAIRRSRRRRGARLVCAIAALCFALPLGFFTVSAMLGHDPFLPRVAPKAETAWREEYTIAKNLDTVGKFFDGSWDSLSIQERIDALQVIANIEQNDLGIPFEINVESGAIRDTTLAYYRHTHHRIVMDIDELMRVSAEESLDSVCHECYHAYQHAQVEAYQQLPEELRGLRLFRSASRYAEEFADYVGDGSMDYYFQYAEMDARDYAERAVEDYSEQYKMYMEMPAG